MNTKLTVTVYDGSKPGSQKPPVNLPEYLEWLTAIVKKIPQEYQYSTVVYTESDDRYSPYTVVEYSRDYTEGELEQMDAASRQRRENLENYEANQAKLQKRQSELLRKYGMTDDGEVA